MSSIKIITMHCPLNYGAVLQTYALQVYLASLGHKVQVIDYNPEYIVYDQKYMYVGDARCQGNFVLSWLYRIYKFPVKYCRKKKFSRFKGKELNLTKRYETIEELKAAQFGDDIFICGSDQIWNEKSGSHQDPSYFLEFVPQNRYKFSYAASGNLNIPLSPSVEKITIPMINRLDRISMREDTTIKNIQPFINKDITHVCDPVFLLNSSIWQELARKESTFKKNEDYVLIYPMGNSELVIQKGYELAKSLHLPLYMITASQKRDSRANHIFNTDPYTFISLIANANVVVTNSFHGTSFCILFKKLFWACPAQGSNQRILSLLKTCNLEDRMITQEGEALSYDKQIAWNLLALEQFVFASKEFINDAIKESLKNNQ